MKWQLGLHLGSVFADSVVIEVTTLTVLQSFICKLFCIKKCIKVSKLLSVLWLKSHLGEVACQEEPGKTMFHPTINSK